MFNLLLAISFGYTIYRIVRWLLNLLDEGNTKEAEPAFTPEEIIQTEVMLNQIELEMQAMEARRKLYDEALRQTRK
ncbi:hypothetical protein ACPTFE_08355 [Enterococcus faecalis]|uniref:hypothetical protein n=1 Tax=Enterococcus faecalis TaxID=1351 RepID=UPI00374ACF10